MSKKKYTPLQEVLKEVDHLAINKAETKEGLLMLSLIKNHIKDILLPKEKEFAREMWDNGWREGYQEGQGRDDHEKDEIAPSFFDYYKQYEQS